MARALCVAITVVALFQPVAALAKPPPKTARLSALESRLLPKKKAAVPELVKVLAGSKAADQLDAASLLSWIRSPDAAAPLAAACGSATASEVRTQACFAISVLLLADGNDLADANVITPLATEHLTTMLAELTAYAATNKAAGACLASRGFVVHPGQLPSGFLVKVPRVGKSGAAASPDDSVSFHASASEGDFYGAVAGGGECGVFFLPIRGVSDLARVAAIVTPPGADPLPRTFVSLMHKGPLGWTTIAPAASLKALVSVASIGPAVERDYRRSGLWAPEKLMVTENALGRLAATPPVNVSPALFRLEADPKPDLDRGDGGLVGAFADYPSAVVKAAVDFRVLEWSSKAPRHEPLLKILGSPASDYLRLTVLGPVTESGDLPIPVAVQIIGSAGTSELRSAAVKAYGSAVVREMKEATTLPADEATAKFGKLLGTSRAALLWDTSESLTGKDSKEACYAALTQIANVGLKAYGEHGRNKDNSEVQAVLPSSVTPQEIGDVLFWGDFASVETHTRNDMGAARVRGGTYIFGQMQRHWFLLGASGWMH